MLAAWAWTRISSGGEARVPGLLLPRLGRARRRDRGRVERAYLVALGEEPARQWLVVDGAGAAVYDRERVREVASLVVLCELAVELAVEAGSPAGGDGGDGAREEAPAGAAAARGELQRALGEPPRLASASWLDRLGGASRGLERVLGGIETPLASALAAHAPVVEAFVAEVEGRHRLPLR